MAPLPMLILTRCMETQFISKMEVEEIAISLWIMAEMPNLICLASKCVQLNTFLILEEVRDKSFLANQTLRKRQILSTGELMAQVVIAISTMEMVDSETLLKSFLKLEWNQVSPLLRIWEVTQRTRIICQEDMVAFIACLRRSYLLKWN
jgi:hypothetical protein